MNRQGHYVKPARRNFTPSVLFSVVVEPIEGVVDGHPERSHRTLSRCAAWCARRVRDEWKERRSIETYDPLELWAWMHERAKRDARNYVISPIASDTLTLSRWWEEAESAGVCWQPERNFTVYPPEDGTTRIRRLVLKGVPDIIDYQRHGYRWIWCSGRQYLPLDEEKIASSMGITWIDTEHHQSDDGKLLRTPRERSRMWLEAMIQLCSWWKSHAKAPWGSTAGQLAMGVMRSHLAPKALCTHNDTDVLRMEREAAFGGRASTWFVGDIGNPVEIGTVRNPAPKPARFPAIPGPLFSVDVRSMYPYLLREMRFPVRLWSYREQMRVKELDESIDGNGVIARVTIQTNTPEYPRRNGSRVEFPIGTFTTTLTGPELQALRRDGKVKAVHSVALYDLAPVFRGCAGELIQMREEARKAGNYAWEFLAKLLGNSLGGKLAQGRGKWAERRRSPAEQQWGEWHQGTGKDGKPRRFRAIAGLVWEWITDQVGGGAHTAAFDYLTAYGRLHTRKLRQLCPEKSVVSQDTDGLWVLAQGIDAMRKAGVVFGDQAGELKLDTVVSHARFFGPRHYFTDQGWVLAGFHHPEILSNGTEVLDTTSMNPIRGSADHAPFAIETVSRHCLLKLDIPGQEVAPSGWVRPKSLTHGI